METFTGNGQQRTDPFDIGTDSWAIFDEFIDAGQGQELSLGSTVYDERGGTVPADLEPADPADAPNTGTFDVESVPGRYSLDIRPSNPDREYTVELAECGGDSSNGGGETTGPTPPPSPPPPALPPPPASPRPSPSPPAIARATPSTRDAPLRHERANEGPSEPSKRCGSALQGWDHRASRARERPEVSCPLAAWPPEEKTRH